MPFERRNEPLMLRQFSRMYPSYNLNPLLRRRHQQLVEAQAFFALHTHRSSRTASAVRAGVSPATQLVAMSLEITSVDQEQTPRKQSRTTGTRRRQQNSSNNNHNNNSTNNSRAGATTKQNSSSPKQQQPKESNNTTTTTTKTTKPRQQHNTTTTTTTTHTKQNANQPRSPEQTQLRPSSEIHKLILDIAPLRIAAGHLRHRCVQLHAYNQ